MGIVRIGRWITAVVTALLLTGFQAQAQNLVTNGGFESGLTGWSTWTASNGFWNGQWIHSNDCDIWVPTNGCPFAGTTSHAQKKGSGAGNAHGGLYQTFAVVPGQLYIVSGQWSGGVTGNVAGANGSWWEVVAYDGVVTDAIIDAGVRTQDALIAKREVNNLANNEVSQFQWQPFSNTFIAQSSTVTVALKVGSFSTFDAAGYHDQLSVTAVPPPVPTPSLAPIPLISLVMLVLVAGIAFGRRNASRT